MKSFFKSGLAVGCLSLCACTSFAAAPANDLFEQAIGVHFLASGTTAEATREEGEPVLPGDTAGQTIWWRWQAPANGQLRLETTQTNYSTALAVFSGDSLASLRMLAHNAYVYRYQRVIPSDETRMREFVTVDVAAGQAYYIAADWHRYRSVWWYFGPPQEDGPAGGPVSLTFRFVPAPENDAFANRVPLSGGQVSLTPDCTGASREPGEPAGLERTLWYEWTAPHGGLVTLSQSALTPKPAPTMTVLEAAFPQPTYDDPDGWPAGVIIPIRSPSSGGGGGYGGTTVIDWPPIEMGGEVDPPPPFVPGFAVYRGGRLDALTLLATSGTNGMLSFQATAGEAYQIAFGSRTVTPGTSPLNLLLTYPPNDDFSARLPLAGVKTKASGYLAGASSEPDEPRHGTDALGITAWWSWRAPEDAEATFTLTPFGFQAALAIYSGDDLASLTPLGSSLTPPDNLTNPPAARVTRSIPGGQNVAIAVDAVSGTPGDYLLDVIAVPAPPSLDALRRGPAPDNRPLLDVGHLRGRKFAVDSSVNMRDWETIFVGIANANQATLEDFTAAGYATRFYRVRLAEPGETITSRPPGR